MTELMSHEDAYNTLYDNVHAQVFLGKLASVGVVPVTEKEAIDLFTLAGRLRHVQTEKKASNSRFSSAIAALDKSLQTNPGFRQSQQSEAVMAVKQAAASVMDDPEIYNAVLSLKVREAQAYAGEDE